MLLSYVHADGLLFSGFPEPSFNEIFELPQQSFLIFPAWQLRIVDTGQKHHTQNLIEPVSNRHCSHPEIGRLPFVLREFMVSI